MSTESPWEISPELTEERLVVIGKTLKETRDGVVELHDPDSGDGAWSLGCRVYERSINKIETLAKERPWLTVHREKLYFIMLIDNLPIKFLRGEFTKPASRSLRKLRPEKWLQQQVLGPGFEPEMVWRIVVETEFNYRVFRMILAHYDEKGNCYFNWEIPLLDSVNKIPAVADSKQEAVKLKKPSVKRKKSGMEDGNVATK